MIIAENCQMMRTITTAVVFIGSLLPCASNIRKTLYICKNNPDILFKLTLEYFPMISYRIDSGTLRIDATVPMTIISAMIVAHS